MVNTNLNDANEEIRRLKLLLGMRIDGGFGEEDDDKLREGTFKRMKIMEEIEEMRVLKKELDQSRENHERNLENLEDFSKKYTENLNHLNALHYSTDKVKKELDAVIQLKHDLSQRILEAKKRERELCVEHKKSFREWNLQERTFQDYKDNIVRLREGRDSSKKELDELEKEYKDMESKFNPKKRKEMESLSGDFEVKIDISGKRNRSNST